MVSKLDPREIFAIPKVYDSYQKFVGAQQDRLNFLKDTVAPLVKSRVLDVGCGTGVNSEVFPQHVSYVGCDLSEKYINHAKQYYGNRAEFYAAPVGELQKLNLKPFDVVIVMAVLHHLSDDQIMKLCDEVSDLLVPGGLMITADPCYTKDQPRFSNFLTSFDRGQFVRFPQQYSSLLERKFSKVDVKMHPGKLLIFPHAGVIMIASK